MIFNVRVLLVICAMLIPLTAGADASPSPSPSTAADPNYVAAEKAIKAKDWKTALSRLNAAKPNADVYNLLGYANRNLGNYDEAFKNYKLALQADPNHKGAHEYVGEAYLLTNNLAMAEQHLASLERICGKNCEEYKDLAHEVAEYKKKK
jgi:tetratricopeptide (TPR) repeat protein